MQGKAETNSLVVIIEVHFLTGDIVIESLFWIKLFQDEPSDTLFNTFLKILVRAEVFYVLIGETFTINLII